jgi:hypothetical protein
MGSANCSGQAHSRIGRGDPAVRLGTNGMAWSNFGSANEDRNDTLNTSLGKATAPRRREPRYLAN